MEMYIEDNIKMEDLMASDHMNGKRKEDLSTKEISKMD